MRQDGELKLTLDDHQCAFTEISFLLEMLVRTAGDVVGRSMPSLATNAGRQTGRKLPVLVTAPSLDKVLDVAASSLSAGFEIAGERAGNGVDLRIGRCVVREVCRQRNLDLGGDLCKVFHFYLAGMMAQLLGKPVRPGAATPGQPCTLRLDAQP